jgi:hypothetical protein
VKLSVVLSLLERNYSISLTSVGLFRVSVSLCVEEENLGRLGLSKNWFNLYVIKFVLIELSIIFLFF